MEMTNLVNNNNLFQALCMFLVTANQLTPGYRSGSPVQLFVLYLLHYFYITQPFSF